MRNPVAWAAIVALAVAAPARAAEVAEVTVEWMYSDEGENATRMPQLAWAGDGTLLLLDERRAEGDRCLERVDPRRGTRAPALDCAAALASLSVQVGEDAAPKALSWPDDLDRAGRQALYTVADDLFVLDLAASRFRRLTRTPAAETVGSFAPDGSRVAFVRDNDLWVAELASGVEHRLTADGAATVRNGELSWVYWEEVFDHEAKGYWWSPDSSSIAFLRSDESAVSELLWPDFRPAVPQVHRQRYPKAGGINPRVSLGVVRAGGGGTVLVAAEQMPAEYVLGVGWTPDSRHVAVQVSDREQTRLDLYLVARADGSARRVLSDPDEAWVNQHELQFLADGRFVWSSERDGHTHLYLYAADGTLLGQLTSGDWSVRSHDSFYGEALGSTWVDEAEGTVYFTGRRESPLEWHLYRVGLDGRGLERVTREPGVHRVSFSPDRASWTDLHSGHCAPPSLTLRRRDGGSIPVAASREGLLQAFGWQCPELLTVPADDGTPLQVRLVRPKPFDPARRYPAILYIYGGPSAPVVRDSFTYSFARNAEFDQILAARGYVVMNVDPRSATAASKRDQDRVVGRVWSDLELADMLAGVRWLKAQPWVDGGRVGVWGWSGGGTSTLLLMTRSREFKAGIAIAGNYDWAWYDTKFAEAYMKTPAGNPEGYAHTSLVARAKDLHGRLMLVHGTYDDNVHPQHTWAVVDELIKAGKPFDLMMYPMRKHGIDDRPARIDLYTRMLEFWQRHL